MGKIRAHARDTKPLPINYLICLLESIAISWASKWGSERWEIAQKSSDISCRKTFISAVFSQFTQKYDQINRIWIYHGLSLEKYYCLDPNFTQFWWEMAKISQLKVFDNLRYYN